MVNVMEKLYVNEICPDGKVSTVGLFYSWAEAENIVAALRKIRNRAGSNYEIIKAVRRVLPAKGSQPPRDVQKE